MNFKGHESHQISRAFTHALRHVMDEKRLKQKEVAAICGIDETALSKLKSGKQDIDQENLSRIELAFPGFEALMIDYLENKKEHQGAKIKEIATYVDSEVDFLKKQVEIWQTLYAMQMDIPPEDREAFIQKIKGG